MEGGHVEPHDLHIAGRDLARWRSGVQAERELVAHVPAPVAGRNDLERALRAEPGVVRVGRIAGFGGVGGLVGLELEVGMADLGLAFFLDVPDLGGRGGEDLIAVAGGEGEGDGGGGLGHFCLFPDIIIRREAGYGC